MSNGRNEFDILTQEKFQLILKGVAASKEKHSQIDQDVNKVGDNSVGLNDLLEKEIKSLLVREKVDFSDYEDFLERARERFAIVAETESDELAFTMALEEIKQVIKC